MPNDTAAADENRHKALEALAHLEALDADPHFTWFVRTVLEKARDDEQANALNVGKTADERDRACWRHDLAKTLCGAAARLRDMYRQTAGLSKGS